MFKQALLMIVLSIEAVFSATGCQPNTLKISQSIDTQYSDDDLELISSIQMLVEEIGPAPRKDSPVQIAQFIRQLDELQFSNRFEQLVGELRKRGETGLIPGDLLTGNDMHAVYRAAFAYQDCKIAEGKPDEIWELCDDLIESFSLEDIASEEEMWQRLLYYRGALCRRIRMADSLNVPERIRSWLSKEQESFNEKWPAYWNRQMSIVHREFTDREDPRRELLEEILNNCRYKYSLDETFDCHHRYILQEPAYKNGRPRPVSVDSALEEKFSRIPNKHSLQVLDDLGLVARAIQDYRIALEFTNFVVKDPPRLSKLTLSERQGELVRRFQIIAPEVTVEFDKREEQENGWSNITVRIGIDSLSFHHDGFW